MNKTFNVILLACCFFIGGCGVKKNIQDSVNKAQATVNDIAKSGKFTAVDATNAGVDLLKDIQNACNNNTGYLVKIDTISTSVTLEVLPKYNKPLMQTDVRKIVITEADSKGKEVWEKDIQYNDDGKVVREYTRHEIPPKNSSGVNMVLDKLIGQTPYFVLLLIALISGGAVIYAKFFRKVKP